MQRVQAIVEVVIPDGSQEVPDGLKAWFRTTLDGALAASEGRVVYCFVTSAFQDPPVVPQPPDGF